MASDSRPVETHIQYTTEAAIVYCFDFTNYSEVLGGATLSNPVIPAVSGITFGTPTVLTATFTQYNSDGTTTTVASGKGVKVAITCTTAGRYTVDCKVDESGGATLTRRMTFSVG